jgi:hypothetical protein
MTWIILGFVIFVAIVLIGRAHSRYLDRQEDIGRICQALENHAATQLGFMVKELNDRNQGRALLAAQTPEAMNRAFPRHIRSAGNFEGKYPANGLTLFQGKRDEERAKPGISARRGRQGGDDGWRPNRDRQSVDVRASRRTSERAATDRLSDRVEVNRGQNDV